MADPKGQVYRGQEGSGLAQIVRTPGIAPSESLQRTVDDRLKKRAVEDARKLENQGRALDMLANTKVGGWSQDSEYLQGLYTSGRNAVVSLMKKYGPDAFDTSTQQGMDNYMGLVGWSNDVGMGNRYTDQAKEYHDQTLTQYTNNPGKYKDNIVDEMEEWRALPAQERMKTDPPVLEESWYDWRDDLKGKEVEYFGAEKEEAKTLESGAVQTKYRKTFDRDRASKRGQSYVDNELTSPVGQAIINDASELLRRNPDFDAYSKDDEMLRDFSTMKKEDYPADQQYLAEDLAPGESWATKMYTDFAESGFKTKEEDAITKAPSSSGKVTDRQDQVSLFKRGVALTQAGNAEGFDMTRNLMFKDGYRVVDVRKVGDKIVWDTYHAKKRENGQVTANANSYEEVANIMNELNKVQGGGQYKIITPEEANALPPQETFETVETGISKQKLQDFVSNVVNVFDPTVDTRGVWDKFKQRFKIDEWTGKAPISSGDMEEKLSQLNGVSTARYNDDKNTLTIYTEEDPETPIEVDLTNKAKATDKLKFILEESSGDSFLLEEGEVNPKEEGQKEKTEEIDLGII